MGGERSAALGALLEGAGLKRALTAEEAALRIANVEYDSRRVQPGSVFFAFPGSRVDGRDFARQAVERGAVAVVSESAGPDGFPAPWIEVEHGRRALALAARNFYGPIEDRISLTGITGTNGKTTTSYVVNSMLRTAGKTTGLVGTIEYLLGGERRPAVNTTPESLDLFRLFGELADRGGTHAVMEVSSHALALARVYGIRFQAAVFTNLTRDHLDFHPSMDDYFRAKRMLFQANGAAPPAFAVINVDDTYGRKIKIGPETERITYAIDRDADVRARKIQTDFEGVRFDLEAGGATHSVRSHLAGRINVFNILAAWGAGMANGLPAEVMLEGIENLRAVSGRFERVDEGQPFLVVVDYAHTDDALRNTLTAARSLATGRVICVFGCGGDRDRTKRPLMGEAAAAMSDFVVLTSDNPRSEDPIAIMNDALVGLRRLDTAHLVEPDRARGIRRALEEAQAGDVVVIAGKGHETYQILGDKTIAFDDREVARTVLRGFGYEKKKGA